MPQAALLGGAPVPVTFDFPFQSYFDSVLLQGALIPQGTTDIVLGRLQTIGGLAVQLGPSSMTPISIDFNTGNGVPSSPIVMKPGQIVRPGRFGSFRWGLPFGWLGGGVATLLVAQNRETDFGAPANSEVIFHRQRMVIQSPAAVNVALAPNWPIRFPWPGAVSGAVGGAAQGQQPVGGVVNPTKIMARLRMAAVPAGGVVTRFILINIDEFDRGSNYVAQASGAIGGACSVDVQWQPWGQSGITVAGGAGALEYQVQELDLTTPIARLGGDQCVVVVVDVTPGAATGAIGQFIDIVRYGIP